MIRKVKQFNEETKQLEYEKSTPKQWAQDMLLDMISQYYYRLEHPDAYEQNVMTAREKELCMEQLKKQADRIAKLFGYNQHWTT